MRRWPAAVSFLLVLCAGIAFVIDVESRQVLQTDAIASEATRPPVRADPVAPTFAMLPLDDFAEVLRRPLFSPTRRPAFTPPKDQPADFRIVGIVISPRDRQALLAHGQPPKVDRVTEGQTLDGWTISSILDNRITATRAEREIELRPSDQADLPSDKADSPRAVQSARQSLPQPPADPVGQPTCGTLPLEACN